MIKALHGVTELSLDRSVLGRPFSTLLADPIVVDPDEFAVEIEPASSPLVAPGVSLSAPPSSVELSVPDPTSGVPPDQLAVTSRVRSSILSVCLSGVLTLVQKFAYRIALLLFHFASALSRRFHQSSHFY